MHRSLGLGLVSLMVGLAGCAAESEDAGAEPASSEDAILGGVETFEHPEIGQLHTPLGNCTATLIRPDVVLSAAHCIQGSPKDEAKTGYSFDVKSSASSTAHFTIDRVYAVPVAADFDGTQSWRTKDISLLRLTTDVPATLAQPLAIATSKPWWGSRVAVYGYGCTSRVVGADGRRPGSGIKRKKEYVWSLGLVFGFSDTQNTCPGDSGGPLWDIASGTVFGTTSGYVGNDDHFGDVPANAVTVNAVANAWWPRR